MSVIKYVLLAVVAVAMLFGMIYALLALLPILFAALLLIAKVVFNIAVFATIFVATYIFFFHTAHYVSGFFRRGSAAREPSEPTYQH